MDNGSPEVVDLIRKKRTAFKICTKVRDEKELLPIWIDHLIKAGFGLDEIIIFDNMSNDSEFIEFLNEIASDVLVISFDGYYNLVHYTGWLKNIYLALAESSDYFGFIDVDEFLYAIDESYSKLYIEGFVKDKLYEFLTQNNSYEIFSLPFLDQSWIASTECIRQSFSALLWGKIIFNSKLYLEELSKTSFGSIHAFMVQGYFKRKINYYPYFPPFVLLHQKFLNAKRVLRTNVYKLRSLDPEQGQLTHFTYAELEALARNYLAKKADLVTHLVSDPAKDKSVPDFVYGTLHQLEIALNSSDRQRHMLKDRYSIVPKDHKIFEIKFLDDLPIVRDTTLYHIASYMMNSNIYLEYSGGQYFSLAIKYGIKRVLVAVDNSYDKNSIVQHVEELGKNFEEFGVKVGLCAINLEKVNENNGSVKYSYIYRMLKQMTIPWENLFKSGLTPDLVIVDGAMKGTKLLICLLLAPPNTTILINLEDHYYGLIKHFVAPHLIVGAMATFKGFCLDDEGTAKSMILYDLCFRDPDKSVKQIDLREATYIHLQAKRITSYIRKKYSTIYSV